MKFKNYLNEASNEVSNDKIDEILNSLRKQCSPFLKEFRDSIRLLYRGLSYNINDVHIKRVVARKDRQPRFIDEKLHEEMGKFLLRKFGWNPRTEGVFTGDYHTASNFGDEYIFFPVGEYKYIWCDRITKKTLYTRYDRFDRNDPKDLKQILDIMDKGYNDKNLNIQLKDDMKIFESIFNCESYYVITPWINVSNYNKGYSNIEELIIGELL